MPNTRTRLNTAGGLGLGDLAQDRPGSDLRELFAPLDRLLISGGDARLALDPSTGRNAYGCEPGPTPDVFSFSSSTATSISPRAYERAGRARDSLMRSAIALGLSDAFDRRVEEMRDELKAYLGLGRRDVEVVFSASGTDSQLHSHFVARSLLGAPIQTIIVGADQTGSGTAYTARGRHFCDRTAAGVRVRRGEPIAGLADPVAGIGLPLMNEDGAFRPAAEIDGMVVAAVERMVAGGAGVLLQIMDSSKLGVRAPSDACLREITKRWPDAVQVVVDACQMRLGRGRIGRYLERGYMVLVTGSKYFTGPPFSGALLVPGHMSGALDALDDVAPGLLDYSGRSDWPKRWSALRSRFPNRPNFGQWLRWEAALEEIGAYYRVPDHFRGLAVRELGAGIAQILEASSSLRLLPLKRNATDDRDDAELSMPTIFPFVLHCGGRALAPGECRAIYRALAAGEEAAQPCLVGQPVELGRPDGNATAALRICVDARHVTSAWDADESVARRNLQRELGRAAAAVQTIELLLGRMDQRRGRVGAHDKN